MYEKLISNENTIKIFDDYIKSKEEFFRIKDNLIFSHNNIYYVINFIISKKQYQVDTLKSNITFTDFKKIYKQIPPKEISLITNCLKEDTPNYKLTDIPKISLPVFEFMCRFQKIFLINTPYNIDKIGLIIKFPIPITINVQTSLNLEYNYENFYGSTSDFLIIGFIVCNITTDKY